MAKRATLIPLMAVLVAGCEIGLPPEVAKCSYISRQHRFAMDVPAGWIWRESAGDTVLFVLGPRQAGVRPTVVVTVTAAAEDTTLEAAVADAKAALARLHGFNLISDEPRQLADGRPARLLTFHQDFGNAPLWQRQLFVPGSNRLYRVTATAARAAAEAEAPNFEVCFRSLRVGW